MGKAKKNYRDAGSGKFVTKKVADKNPRTTVSEPRPKGK